MASNFEQTLGAWRAPCGRKMEGSKQFFTLWNIFFLFLRLHFPFLHESIFSKTERELGSWVMEWSIYWVRLPIFGSKCNNLTCQIFVKNQFLSSPLWLPHVSKLFVRDLKFKEMKKICRWISHFEGPKIRFFSYYTKSFEDEFQNKPFGSNLMS